MAKNPRTQNELDDAYSSTLNRLTRRCDEFYDEGEIIFQASVEVTPEDSADDVAAKIVVVLDY